MSRIYENGYRIEYPNELAYAGMPAIVRVSQLDTAYIGVGITIKVGENYYTETRTPYNGEVVFDISRYMQTAFIGRNFNMYYGEAQSHYSGTQANVSVAVQLTNSTENKINALAFDVNALVGYMQIGKANGGDRRRMWFVNFPQTFDLYCEQHANIWLGGQYISHVSTGTEYRQISVDLSPSLGYDTEGLQSIGLGGDELAYLAGDALMVSQRFAYRLTIDRCTSGVYLRWLDNFGQWCYYLFRVTGRNYTTKETQSWQDGILRNELNDEGGVFLASGQTHQQMAQQESISLGAKLVDAETFDFLLTLTNSPIVEVMTNADDYIDTNTTLPLWERVSVVAGSYARTGAPLQDFAVSIVRNTQTSQML